MSLEAALNRNSELLERLIAVLSSGAITPAPVVITPGPVADTPAKPGRKPRVPSETPTGEPPAAEPAVAATNPGTESIYLHIPKHNTVAEVKPGEVLPSIAGAVTVTKDEYDALKAKYASPAPSAGPAAPTGATAASPAAATSAASPASSQQPTASPQASSGDTGAQVLAKATAAHKNIGNPGLLVVLKHFGAARVPDLVANTAKHADILRALDAVIALPGNNNADHVAATLAGLAAATQTADPANLFG